jgi:hypothetical protein
MSEFSGISSSTTPHVGLVSSNRISQDFFLTLVSEIDEMPMNITDLA